VTHSRRHPFNARHLRGWLAAAALAALIAAAAAAAAPPGERELLSGDQIKITADTLVADSANRTAEFSGHVEAVQGTTVIRSDRLIIHYRAAGGQPAPEGAPQGNIQRIEAIGNVVIEMDQRVARSERAVYETDAGTLVLTGPNTTVREGENSIQGSRVTLYRAEERIKVEGEGQRRVEAIFFPNASPPSD
jgi:lipopolysaccharide export system protein LptA